MRIIPVHIDIIGETSLGGGNEKLKMTASTLPITYGPVFLFRPIVHGPRFL